MYLSCVFLKKLHFISDFIFIFERLHYIFVGQRSLSMCGPFLLIENTRLGGFSSVFTGLPMKFLFKLLQTPL